MKKTDSWILDVLIQIIIFTVVTMAATYFVVAIGACQEIQSPGAACSVLTPVLDCSTYDLYNDTLDLNVDDGIMSQIGATGVYNFTLNLSGIGQYKIILCDNTTATIEVANYSNQGIYEEVQSVTNVDGSWLDNLVKKVWAHIVGYVNPSTVSLNASDTLKTIAENTEYGGY